MLPNTDIFNHNYISAQLKKEDLVGWEMIEPTKEKLVNVRLLRKITWQLNEQLKCNMEYGIYTAFANKVLLLVLSSQVKQHLLFYIAKCHDKGSNQPVGVFKLRNIYRTKDLSSGNIPFFVTISLKKVSDDFTPQPNIDCKEADHVISTEYEFVTPEVNEINRFLHNSITQ